MREEIKAGEAFKKMVERDPATKAGLARAQARYAFFATAEFREKWEQAAKDWVAWKVGTRGASANTRGNLARAVVQREVRAD